MRVVVRDWLNANQVLFLGTETTLIDTGYGDCLADTLARLRAPDVLGERRLDRIVNTHGHSDHIGGNAALKRLHGCRISVPEGAAPLFAAWDTRALWLDYADQQAEPFVHDDVIRPGEVVEMGGLHWQALAAPGHDMDALLFHCPEERLLIPGDALWANGFGVVMPSEQQERLRAARDTAVATALSPAAILDFAVVLWRNLKLVREIAAAYGARPGYVGSLKLLRRMLANIAVAGVAESAHHVAVEALGGSLAAAVSTRMGQGVINGLLTARVGITAMHLCRPIAFGPSNRPSLGRIRRELLSLPKEVL